MKAGIIGLGTIGGCLFSELVDRGFEVVGMTQVAVFDSQKKRIDAQQNWLAHFSRVNIVCLCIPTQDGGERALDYIKICLDELDVPVVTSEKGSLGNYYSELAPKLSRIGFRAAVGGKTGMALELHKKANSNTESVYAVLNATLNFIFSKVAAGKSLNGAVEEAISRCFAEPGAKNVSEVINAEIRDAVLKTAILFNVGIGGCSGHFVRAKDIKLRQMIEKDWDQLFCEAAERRYVVSITKDNISLDDIIGGFNHRIGGWNIVGGFWKKEKCPLFQLVNPLNEDNALAVFDSGKRGRIGLIGEGAGPRPTVSAMLQDIRELLNFSAQ